MGRGRWQTCRWGARECEGAGGDAGRQRWLSGDWCEDRRRAVCNEVEVAIYGHE